MFVSVFVCVYVSAASATFVVCSLADSTHGIYRSRNNKAVYIVRNCMRPVFLKLTIKNVVRDILSVSQLVRFDTNFLRLITSTLITENVPVTRSIQVML